MLITRIFMQNSDIPYKIIHKFHYKDYICIYNNRQQTTIGCADTHPIVV